jgi:Glu-tRNA(Gln) amidotransferase subunit E-like FAD-binding protein
VNKDGGVGEESEDQRVVRDAIIRDTESAIIMSIETAERVKNALDTMIKKYKEIKEKQPKKG